MEARMLTLPGHLILLLFREFASFHVVEVFVCFLWLLFYPDFVCLRFVIFWIIDFVLYVGIWSLSIFVIHELATASRARTVFRTPSVFISSYIFMCVSWALCHVVCFYAAVLFPVFYFPWEMTNMDNDHIPTYSTKSIIQKITNRRQKF